MAEPSNPFAPREPFRPGGPFRVRRTMLIGTRTMQPGQWLSWRHEREFSERMLRLLHEQGVIDTPNVDKEAMGFDPVATAERSAG